MERSSWRSWHGGTPTLCHLLAFVVLWTALAAVPMFLDKDRQTYILQDDENWDVGPTTQITARQIGQSLRVNFRVETLFEPAKRVVVDSLALLYRCTSESASNLIVLWDTNPAFNATAIDSSFCNSSLEFSIGRLALRAYNITFLRNNLAYENTLQHSLELKMQLVISNRSLQSASLFIFNIAPIAEINTELEALNVSQQAVNYTRYILTRQGIQFLLGQFTPEIDGVGQVRFLDKNFTSAWEEASQLLQGLLSVTVALRFVTASSRPGCEPQPADDLALFYSGGRDSLLDLKASSASLAGHINLRTGDLMFPNRLDYLMASRANGSRLRVCLRVSLNSRDWQKQEIVKEVMEFQHFATGNFVPRTRHGKTCDVNVEASQKRLILHAGLQEVAVASPIVCMEPLNMRQTLIGYFCRSPVEPEATVNRHRRKCGAAETHSKGFGMAFFTEPLDSRQHSGALTFTYGQQHHQFNLTVVSPPMFATRVHWSGLVSKAVLSPGYPLTLRCAAFSAYLMADQVIVSASFRLTDVTASSDLTYFSRNILKEAPNFVRAVQYQRDHLLSVLEIRFPELRLKRKRNLTDLQCSLVCEAALNGEAARILGVQSFETLTYAILEIRPAEADLEASCGGRGGRIHAALLTAALLAAAYATELLRG